MRAPKRVPGKPKAKPRGKPFTGADDPRRIAPGRPSDDDSWAGCIRKIQAMTADEIADWLSGPLSAEFRKMPKGVPLKQIIILRWMSSQINEPSIGLIKELIDRTDGPVVQESNDKVETVIRVIRDDKDDQPKTETTPQGAATDESGSAPV